MTGTVSIEIVDLRFIKLCWRDIALMHNAGIFNFKNGSMTVHRDADGNLRKIDVDKTIFRV